MQTNMQAIQNTQMALQAMVESLARDRDRKLMLERLNADAAADAAATSAAAGSSPPGAPGSGDVVPSVAPDATPQQRLEAARVFLTQLEVGKSPKHPDVLRVKRLIADLERQVAAKDLAGLQPPSSLALDPVPERPGTPEEARNRDRLRQMKASKSRASTGRLPSRRGEERRLRAEIGGYQSRLESVPGIESEWVGLTRDYDTLAATYRELLSKSENSKMAASLEQRQIGEQFRVLDPPRVPLKPNSPNRARINLMGTIAGLGVGLLLLGLTYVRDSTMRSEADVLGAIELPVLVLLPFVATEADLRREQRLRWMTWAAAVAAFAGTAALVWFLRLWKIRRRDGDPGLQTRGEDRWDISTKRFSARTWMRRRARAPRRPRRPPRPGASDRMSTATAPGPRDPRRASPQSARPPGARLSPRTSRRRRGAGSTRRRSNASSGRKRRGRCLSSSSGASRPRCSGPRASGASRASS